MYNVLYNNCISIRYTYKHTIYVQLIWFIHIHTQSVHWKGTLTITHNLYIQEVLHIYNHTKLYIQKVHPQLYKICTFKRYTHNHTKSVHWESTPTVKLCAHSTFTPTESTTGVLINILLKSTYKPDDICLAYLYLKHAIIISYF